MRAGYFPELGVAEFRSDMPEPQIRYDKDVKIRIRKCGICGSEVHALHGMHPFRIPPVLSGHEFAGDVVEVGKGVTKFKPGDRVTGEPQYGCGECYYCKHGMYNLCTSKRVLGASYKVPELDNGEWTGSMGEYIVVPEKTVVKLADNVSYEEGALIEPVANGIYAVRFRRDNGVIHDGVAAFGYRPTVTENGVALLETILFDYSGHLYGQTCAVSFFGHLRDELKFDGLEPLVAQIRKDEEEARALLSEMQTAGEGDDGFLDLVELAAQAA